VRPLTDQPDQWLAWNPGQHWRTRFDGRGFLITPATAPEAVAAWQWGLQLQSYGFPGQERAVGQQATVTTEAGRVTYGWAGGLEEWFSNEARGLEHGFTLRQRPAGAETAGAALTLRLAVRGTLRPRVLKDGQGVAFRDAAGAAVVNYTGLKVWDADGREVAARLEASGAEVRLRVEEGGALPAHH
jgi:hypothetical protein